MAAMAELPRPPQQQKLNGAYYVPNAYGGGSGGNGTGIAGRHKRPSSPPRRSRIGFCCRCLCVTLLALIVALGVAALVIWLLFRPKIPKYSVQDVQINALNLTSGSRSVNTNLVISVRAENPNKHIKIKYGGIHSRVMFPGGSDLGSGDVAPFTQPRRNVTVVRVGIRGDGVAVPQAVAAGLRSALGRGNVPLVVDVNVRAKIVMGKASTFWFRVRVRCDVRVSPPGAAGGSKLISRNCKVRKGKFW